MRSDIGGESCDGGDGGVVPTLTIITNSQTQQPGQDTQRLNMCLDRQRHSAIIPARKYSPVRLQRKIKAVINLNKFWSELEENYRSRTSSRVLVWKVETDTEELENDINENIERLRRISSPEESS